jgi:6-phosphofructokinase 1
MMHGQRRIAINAGGGFVPGLDLVAIGAVKAADKLGWEVFGIRDGYDGVLFPEQYPEGGIRRLTPTMVRNACGVLGTAARSDPFHVRRVTEEQMVEEIDRSGDVLAALRNVGVDAVISVVGASSITGIHALSVAWKLHRLGLPTICIPKSIENDVPDTALAFGYNSVLGHATDLLDRIRVAARDAGRLAVAEVPGQHAGWLALQAGLAALADAVLIPEIPYDITKVAAALNHEAALIVVAENAAPVDGEAATPTPATGLRGSLSPLSDPHFGEGVRVIERAGRTAHSVALALQRLTDRETLPLVLGQLVRGGEPTAVDRQLGLGYGAAAVRALETGETAAMLSFQPPELRLIPLRQALNRVRTVPADSPFVQIARMLGISLGD